MQSCIKRFRGHGRAVIALLLAAFVLLLNGLVALPHAHQCLHHDANSGQHRCAVTVFEQGQVEAGCFEVVCQPSTAVPTSVLPAAFSTFAPVIANLPTGRAPPPATANS
jgi:hypothetical protein